MADNAEKLSRAIKAKSEIEGFLANLEKLKSEGDIDDEQYLTTRKDYYRRLGAATSEIARLKNELKEQLAASEQSLELSRKNLASLDVKRKVGELSDAQYQAAERKSQSEISNLEKEVEELNTLVNASSAADMPVTKKRAAAGATKPAPVAREAPVAKAEVADKPIAPAKGRGLSRSKLLAIIGAAAVVIIAMVAGFLFLRGQGDRGWPSLSSKEYTTFDMPVNITGAARVGSLKFELAYDSNLLIPVEVEKGSLPEDALFEYSIDVPGKVVIGMVCAQGISGDLSAALITFQTKDEIDQSTQLHLENIVAYGAATMSQITATASSGSYSKDGTYQAPVLSFLGTTSQ